MQEKGNGLYYFEEPNQLVTTKSLSSYTLLSKSLLSSKEKILLFHCLSSEEVAFHENVCYFTHLKGENVNDFEYELDPLINGPRFHEKPVSIHTPGPASEPDSSFALSHIPSSIFQWQVLKMICILFILRFLIIVILIQKICPLP